jgi:N-acetylated-alpha-linked acidic dipeptidase
MGRVVAVLLIFTLNAGLAAEPVSPVITGFTAQSESAEVSWEQALASAQGKTLSPDRLLVINQQLSQAERKLTSGQGLPRRPWMQHLLYAPGWYTGYSAKTMPGVREAIEEGRYTEAEEQVELVAHSLQDEAAWVEQITKELAGN